MGRPEFAYVHLSACSGCEISFLDNYERLLEMMDMVDFKYMTILMDETEIPEVDIVFIDGAACLQSKESVEALQIARKNAGYLVAWGGCSSTATINSFSRGGQMPQPQHESFPAINKLVKVDAFVPGCPPGPEMAYRVINAFATGDTDYLKYLTSEGMGGFSCGCDLLSRIVGNSLCIGCGTCAFSCPTRAISMPLGRPSINWDRCVKCGACYAGCPRSFQPLDLMNRMMEEL